MVHFGLQKERRLKGDIDAELNSALATLRKKYNFSHLDSSHGRNAIYVEGDNGNTRKRCRISRVGRKIIESIEFCILSCSRL
jgi:hypothetical protein